MAVLSLQVMAPAAAHDYTAGTLRIEHPSARPTPPGARTGGAYFSIRNVGTAGDRLISAASPVAESVQIHSMTMDGNLMKMRAIAALDIPAGSTVTLGSGGYHVMLIGLRRPLAVGDQLSLSLTFEKAGTIQVSAYVEAPKMPVNDGTKPAHRH
jgi:copper(I)-binding protein